MAWRLRVTAAAREEIDAIPDHELGAVMQSLALLSAYAQDERELGFPRSSAVAPHLRELRPSAGHSPWRAFYGRINDTIWVVGIGNKRRRRAFQQAIERATQRLRALKEG
jgi:phage-related protein